MRNDETMSTGEAAAHLTAHLRPTSIQTVRRLVAAGALRAQWTRRHPALWSTDRRGYTMRGHRRVVRASVEALVRDLNRWPDRVTDVAAAHSEALANGERMGA